MPRFADVGHIRTLKSDPRRIRNLAARGMISPRSARRIGGDYEIASTSRDGRRLAPDEGDRRNRGAIPSDHLNDTALQRGGRASKGGSAGPERNPAQSDHIDAARNRRQFPAKTGHWLTNYASPSYNPPQGIRGGVDGSTGNPGDWYSGGSGR